MRAASTITAHPRMPDKSIPLATVTSARNTVRLHAGLKFSVASFSKTSFTLDADSPGMKSIFIGSQASMNEDEVPTILTSDAVGLPLVTSGLIRLGMAAEIVDAHNGAGEKVMAIRIDLALPNLDDYAIVFENIQDGNITLRKDGKPDKVIGKVIRGLLGSGRIDGTENLGSGCIAKLSQNCVVISSSDEPSAPVSRFTERRGGVAIQTMPDNQPYVMMIKDPIPAQALVGLAFGGKSHVADVLRENGDWERFPSFIGHRADTFVRPHSKGQVIALRIRPTNLSPLAQAVQSVALQYEKLALADAAKRKVPVISGIHTLRISPTDPGRVASLKIRIEDLLFVMNVKPFFKTWDTTSLPDGIHTVVVELLDDSGALITTTRQEIYVRNRNLSSELSSCQW